MTTSPSPLYHDDASVIEALGGPAELARKLGFELPRGVQRVQNWKYRGIPEIERLRRPDIFGAVVDDPDADRIGPPVEVA
ncbi:hypothetical protein WQ56_00765 [Luteimonas sp. FCS-9]|nr:hypothetical protein WQ56_00765 [Luteimonas sp. FCS-9]